MMFIIQLLLRILYIYAYDTYAHYLNVTMIESRRMGFDDYYGLWRESYNDYVAKFYYSILIHRLRRILKTFVKPDYQTPTSSLCTPVPVPRVNIQVSKLVDI